MKKNLLLGLLSALMYVSLIGNAFAEKKLEEVEVVEKYKLVEDLDERFKLAKKNANNI